MKEKVKTKSLVNCAIYTRKSCEEGLEQEFNSLDAQYEAGKAYITSQKSEGWKVYKRYDDGGYSGGNIERPSLKQLMQDIESGYINCVVVYKVDRLSRSLPDFFKLMEIFDKKNISFVSVTQSFNTTNSMGKLTLNILLSFAQFEREVTGERIRDKISASKKKGLWMGGVIPLGYDLIERKLKPNEEESKVVNYIFESYIQIKSIDRLRQKLKLENLKTKKWTAVSGRVYGDKNWTNSMLQRLLRNPTYIGKISHNKNAYEGEHEAIIGEDIFNQVQEILENQNQRNNEITKIGKYLLFKKLYNEKGKFFKCDGCVKTNKGKNGNKKVRYNYYITEDKRLNCEKIDKIATELVKQFVNAKHTNLNPAENDELTKINWDNLEKQKQILLIKHLIEKVIYKDEEVRLEIKRESLNKLKEFQSRDNGNLERVFNHQLYISSDNQTINIIADIKTNKIIPNKVNKNLLKALVNGYKYRKLIESGVSLKEISEKENKRNTYISRIIAIGYLSPKIVECIFKADHNEKLTIGALEKIANHSMEWKVQENMFCQYR